jgi:hypothetical protein
VLKQLDKRDSLHLAEVIFSPFSVSVITSVRFLGGFKSTIILLFTSNINFSAHTPCGLY